MSNVIATNEAAGADRCLGCGITPLRGHNTARGRLASPVSGHPFPGNPRLLLPELEREREGGCGCRDALLLTHVLQYGPRPLIGSVETPESQARQAGQAGSVVE